MSNQDMTNPAHESLHRVWPV